MRSSASRRPAATLTAVLLVLFATTVSGAQTPSDRATNATARTGWHVVRPTDNLFAVATRYLGDAERWPEIHALNPEIEDANEIYPGQRLRVPLPGQLLSKTAQIVRTARRVEDQMQPLDWGAAEDQDLILPRDAVRTFTAASAQLLLSDGMQLTLTESSLVFLGERGDFEPGSLIKPPSGREKVEIVIGQADLDAGTSPTATAGVDIVIGDAVTTSRSTADEPAQTRARRDEEGAAQLMVYGGESDVTAAGATVALTSGMGVTIEEGEPPGEPETLLPAPAQQQPPSGTDVYGSRPAFEWAAVDGATSYVVEVCADPGCGALVARQVGEGGVSWAPTNDLPTGGQFWRVTAVSATGLDGFPSAAAPFNILSANADLNPPVGRIAISGPQHRGADGLWLGPGARLEAIVEDDVSGVGERTFVIDGTDVDENRWGGDWSTGAHTVTVQAADRARNRMSLDPLEFSYDDQPPTITWGPESDEDHTSAAETTEIAAPAEGIGEGAGEVGDDLAWSPIEYGNPVDFGSRSWAWEADLPWFSVVKPGGSFGMRHKQHRSQARFQQRRVQFPTPHIIVRPRGDDILIGDQLSARSGKGIEVRAGDDGSGLESMRFWVTSAAPRSLVVEAVDNVGNQTRVSWPLALADPEN